MSLPEAPPIRLSNDELDERPAKRSRIETPAQLDRINPPQPPTSSFHRLQPPSQYFTHPPTSFQQPLHLTSFSYSPTRELLTKEEVKDASLSYYKSPPLGADLNQDFNQAVWRDGSRDEGLDALLDTLLHWTESDQSGGAAEILARTTLITWRGMMTKLMLAVYETSLAANETSKDSDSRSRVSDGWEMNAMVLGGTLYLEEAMTPSKLDSKAKSEQSYLRQSYYGYSFESFSTTSSPSSQSHEPPSIPNTNVQWCSIVKTNLGGFRSILGGEVDCISLPPSTSPQHPPPISTSSFVELKTNIIIQSRRDEIQFEKLKLLKHYAQSFLLGVPRIIVGFRTRTGVLQTIQEFRTLEIPKMIRGKAHAWDPNVLLASGFDLLRFLFKTIFEDERNRKAEVERSVDDWPVFRINFVPQGVEPGLRVRLLSREEVEQEVWAGKKEEERVGFLLKRWVDAARKRQDAKKTV